MSYIIKHDIDDENNDNIGRPITSDRYLCNYVISGCLGFAKYSGMACGVLRRLPQFWGEMAAYINIGWFIGY